MTDTTTIEIRDEQKDALDDLKTSPHEPYKAVLERLIESYESPERDSMGDCNDVLNRLDDLENTLPRKIAEELR